MATRGTNLGFQPRDEELCPEAPPLLASLTPGVHSEARMHSLRTLDGSHFDSCRFSLTGQLWQGFKRAQSGLFHGAGGSASMRSSGPQLHPCQPCPTPQCLHPGPYPNPHWRLCPATALLHQWLCPIPFPPLPRSPWWLRPTLPHPRPHPLGAPISPAPALPQPHSPGGSTPPLPAPFSRSFSSPWSFPHFSPLLLTLLLPPVPLSSCSAAHFLVLFQIQLQIAGLEAPPGLAFWMPHLEGLLFRFLGDRASERMHVCSHMRVYVNACLRKCMHT